MRQAIIFNLVPAPDLEDDASLASNESSGTSDLQTLRTRALAAVTTPTQADRTTAKRNVHERAVRYAPMASRGRTVIVKPAHVQHRSWRSAARLTLSPITFGALGMAVRMIHA
jgi:hypothetical protein